jgi:hypothetical protein
MWSTLPFLPLFDCVSGTSSAQMPNSSRFAAKGNVTFDVLGGKSGKIAARNGNEVATDGTVGGKNGKVRRGNGQLHVAKPVIAIR